MEPAYFVDGVVIEKDYIYIASKLKSIDHDEHDHSRMSFLDFQERDLWFYHDLNWDVRSVCVKGKVGNEPRKYCALSAQGEVELQFPGGFDLEKIEGAGSFEGLGAVRQIKHIGKHLYVCGDQGQIYKRSKANKWVHFDKGVLDKTISASATDLTSIDGVDEDTIYTVGLNGEIFCYSQKKWSKLASPTKAHLERVKCVSNEEVYICGNNGVVLKGNKEGFTNISDSSFTENLWGIEVFHDTLYLASLKGLYTLKDGKVTPVKTGLTPEIKGYRLYANDGVLWSFGVDDLAFFDGTTWQRIIHPDNA